VATIVKLLVTGAAGFIGFHTSRLLLERGDEVVGLDNLNAYYDPALKQARLEILTDYPQFRFVKADIADREAMEALFHAEKFQRVVHLAAQAGVRYSIENPHAYVHSNITGFLQVIEGCRRNQVEHLVYASTSSVYGANTNLPFTERQGADHPLTLYAATKRSNELMAHSYSSLYGLPTTGLRFFTVYGPWGRPDMALFLFTKNILAAFPSMYLTTVIISAISPMWTTSSKACSRPWTMWQRPTRHGIPIIPIPAPAAFHTGFITSAIRHPSLCCAISRCWNNAWGKKRKEISCPCNWVICRIPGPMWRP
jgi:nucleoside-diphosphate-sugar epimerase